MIKLILFFFLLFFSTISNSEVYFMNGMWVGNICMSFNGAWSRVPMQPLGSFCQIMMPNGMVVQGQIVNM